MKLLLSLLLSVFRSLLHGLFWGLFKNHSFWRCTSFKPCFSDVTDPLFSDFSSLAGVSSSVCFSRSVLLPAVPVGTRGSSPWLCVTVGSAYPRGHFTSCLQHDCQLCVTSPHLSWQPVLLTACWVVIATIPPTGIRNDTESLLSLDHSHNRGPTMYP